MRLAAGAFGRLVLLLAALLLAAPARALTSAGEVATAPTALDRLLAPSRSPWLPGARRMLEMLAELPLRKAFKRLDDDLDWGPDNPRWTRLLPEFRSGYLAQVAPDEAALRALLAARLNAALEPEEIAELADSRRAPELERLLNDASRLGLDLGLALRTTDLAAAPELYGQAEIAEIRNALAKMKGHDAELQELLLRLQAISGNFAGPAFARYQAIMLETLQPIAAANIDDRDFRQRFDAWLAVWQERVRRR